MANRITWSRTGGYEVSSAGDKRFSAFNAILDDGRSIECWYQCDVKGFDPGGTNWKLGKGKKPLRTDIDLYEEYKKLWLAWAVRNRQAMHDLYLCATNFNNCLSDKFATTDVNQARALSDILNAWYVDPLF